MIPGFASCAHALREALREDENALGCRLPKPLFGFFPQPLLDSPDHGRRETFACESGKLLSEGVSARVLKIEAHSSILPG